MRGFILIGRTKKGSLECIYCGDSGTDLEAAAALAAESKEFSEIGKIVNPSHSPMPIDPTPTTSTKPRFPAGKPVEVEAKQFKSPFAKLEELAEKMRQEREKGIEALPEIKVGPQVNQGAAQANPEIDPNAGPTFEEYVKAGYKPETYPPKGYNAKESPGWKRFQKSK